MIVPTKTWLAILASLSFSAPGAAQSPTQATRHAEYWEQTIRGIQVHLPHPYLGAVFGNDGFIIAVRVADSRPLSDGTQWLGSPRPEWVTISVGGQRRFEGRDLVRRRITLRAEGPSHRNAVETDRLDGVEGSAIPPGLIYRRAAAPAAAFQGSREDMFTPVVSRRNSRGEPLPEAVFCRSATTPLWLDASESERGPLRCQWMMVWRDLEVSVALDRQHLWDLQRLRPAMALLDSVVVSGPAEAGPPPEPLSPTPR